MRQEFEQILSVANSFSTTTTPVMIERERLLDVVTEQIAAAVVAGPAGRGWSVQKGGHRGSFAPVAWVRVYQSQYSPNATTGFYLVYLFAADGSAVFLSLNQGTSERQGDRMVPMGDTEVIRNRSAEARRALAEQESAGVLERASIAVDLASDANGLSDASARRIENYEFGNVYAVRYSRGSVPDDADLSADLLEFLPCLATLYTGAAIDSVDVRDVLRPPDPSARPWSRRLLDSKVRHAIEVFAEDVAIKQLHDWKVTRVGHLHRGYDLDCHRGNERLHLEVKGTTTLGEEVVLTPNEVVHPGSTQCTAQHGLFVVANLRAQRSADGTILVTGGTVRLMTPWRAESERLTPSEFLYKLPPDGAPSDPSM